MSIGKTRHQSRLASIKFGLVEQAKCQRNQRISILIDHQLRKLRWVTRAFRVFVHVANIVPPAFEFHV